MKKPVLILICVVASLQLLAQTDMVKIKSNHDVATTLTQLKTVLSEKGMHVFDIIDHAAGARSAGLELRPTVLVIFGNPKVGTQLMRCDQSIAIELPLKILIWQDEGGNTWICYWDPQALENYFNLADCKVLLTRVSQALQAITAGAALE